MKIALILLMFGACVGLFRLETRQKKPSMKIASQPPDTIAFKTHVQPIFEKHCSPCHFPGGKMYEKLPFDRSETIVTHQQRILKRLKNEEDINLIRQYLQQNDGY